MRMSLLLTCAVPLALTASLRTQSLTTLTDVGLFARNGKQVDAASLPSGTDITGGATLQAALGPLADRLEMTSCARPYGLWWWTRERSLVGVSIETLKLGFYTLRYFTPAALGLLPDRIPPGSQNPSPDAVGNTPRGGSGA